MYKHRCFVAYSSNPPALAETIETAITKISEGDVVTIHGWKSLAVGGKYIITEICRAIDDSDLFIADLTGLNHNVLFELGYPMHIIRPNDIP
jgi:hypothetical protein